MSTTVFFSKTVAVLEELRPRILTAHVQGDLDILLRGIVEYLDGPVRNEVQDKTEGEHGLAVVKLRLNEFQQLMKGRAKADAEDQFEELLSVLHGVSREERSLFYQRWGISAELMADTVAPVAR